MTRTRQRTNRRLRPLLAFPTTIAVVLSALVAARSDDAPAQPARAEYEAAQQALEQLNPLIGAWRGTGQTKRGSNRGAWLEKAEWVWNFNEAFPAIEYRIESGKQLVSARLTFDTKRQQYVLTGKLPGNVQRTYVGALDGKTLTLDSQPDDSGQVHRLTIDCPNEKRAVVRYETRLETQSLYSQAAIVGYTREGTRLATDETTGPECIVTGGAGTIRIEHQGKNYYVCCTGCRDAFLAKPQEYLAQAAEKRKTPPRKSAR